MDADLQRVGVKMMRIGAVFVALACRAGAELTVSTWGNLALEGAPLVNATAPSLSPLSLANPVPGAPFSAEALGTLNLGAAGGLEFVFRCEIDAALDAAFVWVDDHLVCQRGVYELGVDANANKTDGSAPSPLRLMSKPRLVVRVRAWGGARVGADHPLSRGGSGKSLEQSPLLEGGTSLQGGAVAKAARDHCTAHWHRKGSTSPAAAAAATHSRAVLGAVQHLAGKIDEIERKHAEETSALKELLAKQQLSLNAIAHRLGATTVAAATVAQRVAERVERESVRQGSEASVRSEGSKGV